jgi:hypothetical protein
MPPKFVPRQRKHKVIARQKASKNGDSAAGDANIEEILPVEQQERNAKKATLKEELVRESQGKVTGKKKKRLDKYIVRLSRGWSDSQAFAPSLRARESLQMPSGLTIAGHETQERRESCAAEEARFA